MTTWWPQEIQYKLVNLSHKRILKITTCLPVCFFCILPFCDQKREREREWWRWLRCKEREGKEIEPKERNWAEWKIKQIWEREEAIGERKDEPYKEILKGRDGARVKGKTDWIEGIKWTQITLKGDAKRMKEGKREERPGNKQIEWLRVTIKNRDRQKNTHTWEYNGS